MNLTIQPNYNLRNQYALKLTNKSSINFKGDDVLHPVAELMKSKKGLKQSYKAKKDDIDNSLLNIHYSKLELKSNINDMHEVHKKEMMEESEANKSNKLHFNSAAINKIQEKLRKLN